MIAGIFVGLSTVDVVYDVDEFPPANSKVVARAQDVLVGGPATNAAVTFGHLGGNVTLATVVGSHSLASIVRDELRGRSIQLIDLNPSFDGIPVISSISVDKGGERNIISANASRITALPAVVDHAILERASVVLVDGHYIQSCSAWAKAAHKRGIRVVFDGGSWKAGTRELLRNVDMVICSADFVPPGCLTEDDVFRYLEGCGVMHIAMTRGADPIRFVSEKTSGVVRVPVVQVVDTMGAGDIFHGAFCYYISTGRGFAAALEEAAGVASQSCRSHGTREWMKHHSWRNPTAIAGTATSVAQGARVLTTPAENSSPAGVAQEMLKIGRRNFIATAVLVGLKIIKIGEMTPDFLDKLVGYKRRQGEAGAAKGELHELLTHYLYPLSPRDALEARVPLVPALQDPWGPSNRKFSGSGDAVAAAYALAFRSWNDQRIVRPVIEVQDDDAPVLIASHLVSAQAARYFGDPSSPRPIHEIRYHDNGGGFSALLRWAIYTPPEAKEFTKLELFQGKPMPRKEPVHIVSDLGDSKLPQPVFVRQGEFDYQQDDYLLISVLPRDSRFDRRMVSLAGLNKPGTLAAERLLSDPGLALKILREIHNRVEGVPYYQALIALTVDHTQEGLPMPTHLRLVDAEPIKNATPVK